MSIFDFKESPQLQIHLIPPYHKGLELPFEEFHLPQPGFQGDDSYDAHEYRILYTVKTTAFDNRLSFFICN